MKSSELKIASWKDDNGIAHSVYAADYYTLMENRDTFQIAEFMNNSWYYSTFYIHNENDVGQDVQVIKLCRLIVNIETYKNGWIHREKTMASIFESFFEANPQFHILKDFASDFYKNIGKPSLYGGSWGNGWKVSSYGEYLFDPTNNAINCLEFSSVMKLALEEYIKSLKAAGWDDLIWLNFRRKFHSELKYWNL